MCICLAISSSSAPLKLFISAPFSYTSIFVTSNVFDIFHLGVQWSPLLAVYSPVCAASLFRFIRTCQCNTASLFVVISHWMPWTTLFPRSTRLLHFFTFFSLSSSSLRIVALSCSFLTFFPPHQTAFVLLSFCCRFDLAYGKLGSSETTE